MTMFLTFGKDTAARVHLGHSIDPGLDSISRDRVRGSAANRSLRGITFVGAPDAVMVKSIAEAGSPHGVTAVDGSITAMMLPAGAVVPAEILISRR